MSHQCCVTRSSDVTLWPHWASLVHQSDSDGHKQVHVSCHIHKTILWLVTKLNPFNFDQSIAWLHSSRTICIQHHNPDDNIIMFPCVNVKCFGTENKLTVCTKFSDVQIWVCSEVIWNLIISYRAADQGWHQASHNIGTTPGKLSHWSLVTKLLSIQFFMNKISTLNYSTVICQFLRS